MHFAKDVYISEKIASKKSVIMRNIKYGKGFSNYFLIYKNPDSNKLECMKSLYFRQKAFMTRPFLIEGIFDSHSEAIEYMAKDLAKSMNLTLEVIYDD